MAASALSASTAAGLPSVPPTVTTPAPSAARPRYRKIWLLLVPLLLSAALAAVGVVLGSMGGRPSARIVAVRVGDAVDKSRGVAPARVQEAGAGSRIVEIFRRTELVVRCGCSFSARPSIHHVMPLVK